MQIFCLCFAHSALTEAFKSSEMTEGICFGFVILRLLSVEKENICTFPYLSAELSLMSRKCGKS